MNAETEWAWLAGIIDGEGSVLIKTHYRNRAGALTLRPTPSPSIVVGMTDEPTIARCRAIAGCGTRRRAEKIGRIKPLYVWAIYAHNAVRVAEAVLPYSVTKRGALEAIIASRGGDASDIVRAIC